MQENLGLVRVDVRGQYGTAVIETVARRLEYRLRALKQDDLFLPEDCFAVFVKPEQRIERSELYEIGILAELLLLKIRVERAAADTENLPLGNRIG